MSERLTLLPCPFCGGEPASYWIQGPHHNSRNNPDHFRVACCVTLEARTRVEAADKWNRRAALSSLSEGWVSVEEQLPEQLRMVLLVTPTSQRCSVDYGYRKGHDFFVQTSAGWDDTRNFGSEVTHWRDLPSPPVGKD